MITIDISYSSLYFISTEHILLFQQQKFIFEQCRKQNKKMVLSRVSETRLE